MKTTIIRNLTAVAFAGCLSVSSVTAQEYSKEHLDAARAAVITSGGLASFDDILPVMSEQAKALFIRSSPALTEVINATADEIALKLAAKRPALDKKIIEVWAARFSIEELEQIQTFYDSPVGQKFYKLSPEIAALSVQEGKIWRDALSTEMVTMLREELIKQGHGQ
ncbi:MAG: DUF2059 domain-containing protein [Stappiaceae bacterium]